MATLGTETGKRGTTWRIRFVDHDSRRQTIRLGKISRRIAETAKVRIEALVAARLAGTNVQVGAKAGVDGRLFGSITNYDIADALGHNAANALSSVFGSRISFTSFFVSSCFNLIISNTLAAGI